MKKMKIFLPAFALFAFMASCNNQATESQTTNNDSIIENTTPAVPDTHNSQNSLTWNGTYKGTLPCADCEGIETTIVLNSDNTFEKTAEYKGKGGSAFTDKGTFTWSEDGSTITLSMDRPEKYKIQEGNIVMLNQDGEVNTGELASHYILTKQ